MKELPADQKFIGYALTRAQIAEELNDVIAEYDEDEICGDIFTSTDPRLTDEACQWYIDQMNGIDLFAEGNRKASIDMECEIIGDIQVKMLTNCGIEIIDEIHLDPDEEFYAVSITRAEIARDLNEHIKMCVMERDDIFTGEKFTETDARLTNELCQWYTKEINVDPFESEHPSVDGVTWQMEQVRYEMLKKCGIELKSWEENKEY